MKTLRAKLFVSVGAIFLAAGILNTISAQLWIKKDLNKAGAHITEKLDEVQEQVRKFVSFLLTFHIVEEATELGRVVEIAGESSPPSSTRWQRAGTCLAYNPDITFIQIQNASNDPIVLAPGDVSLKPFSWAFDQEKLWVQIEGEEGIFEAKPNADYYLLFRSINPSPSLKFHSIPLPSYSFNWTDSSEHLFSSLLEQKNQWLQKIELIQKLLPLQESKKTSFPAGILKLDREKKLGSCLLTKGLFLETALVDYSPKQEQDIPDLILRNTHQGKELDMVRSFSFLNEEKEIMTIGFSLSAILKDIAIITQKNIFATGSNFSIGYTDNGKSIDLKKTPFSLQKDLITWDGSSFASSLIDLDVIKIFLLTPLNQATYTNRFLSSLNENIIDTISLSLMSAALFSFAIAMLLLSNISKKITGPIATLSTAAEALGKGRYENLVLPEIDHRKDEVASLASSFKGMVSALKEREKIQGLLNKVVSKEISQKILEQNVELSGEEKVVTLMFSDIRNFTHLAEELPPHSLIEILNAYMTRMCRIIDETHGVVDKFIGDAIMTLYGAPIALDFHAVQAISASLAMKEDLIQWNKERKSQSLTIFEIGIGIHTGLVYTGNMGAENRLNYTAIGANVNQASRLCSIAKPMQILISEDTFKSPGVAEKFTVQKLDPVFLKGIERPVEIYEVVGIKY